MTCLNQEHVCGICGRVVRLNNNGNHTETIECIYVLRKTAETYK